MRAFVSLSVCAATVLTVSGGLKIADSLNKQNRVYAAADSTGSSIYEGANYDLPSGIAGVASGVSGTPSAGMTINRIGTSCEDVIVGQRVQKITSQAVEMNVSESMAMTIDDFDSKVVSSAKMMSDEDYQNLLQIVEAEAGTEDIKGRVMVANVIMNRVKYSEFPDNVTDVIWEYDNGVAQFSPVEDGRISEVTVSQETKDAVRQVLEGTDYSQGALFFIQKSAAARTISPGLTRTSRSCSSTVYMNFIHIRMRCLQHTRIQGQRIQLRENENLSELFEFYYGILHVTVVYYDKNQKRTKERQEGYMQVLYKSTRGKGETVTASMAILKGLSEDGGLFVPTSIPKLDVPVEKLAQMTYQETAYEVMSRFLTDFTEEELKNCIANAYDEKFDTTEIAPLHEADGAYYLELFHVLPCFQGYGTVHSSTSYDNSSEKEPGQERHRDPDCNFRRYR